MYGSADLFTALNVSAITDGLDNYVVGENTYKALFGSNVLPSDFTGNKSINFYMSMPFNAALDYEQYNYSANCRAGTYNESLTIAKSVIDEVNRKSYTNYFITVLLLPTIKPLDDTDNYNTPLELTIQKRGV